MSVKIILVAVILAIGGWFSSWIMTVFGMSASVDSPVQVLLTFAIIVAVLYFSRRFVRL